VPHWRGARRGGAQGDSAAGRFPRHGQRERWSCKPAKPDAPDFRVPGSGAMACRSSRRDSNSVPAERTKVRLRA